MSKLTAKQRRELPLEDFGDPSKRLYPILDQDDVDSAARLIGKAADPDAVKKRIIAIAKRKGLSIPDAWKAATMAALAAIALPDGATEPDEQGMVRRTALLTKPGDFPAHGWSISPDELKASADAFTGPGYVEIQHFTSEGKPSILDGYTGYLDGVWTSEDGEELYGDLVLPEWLNTIADANGGKVSAVFTKEEKELKGVGLVLEPAVPEAAMLSAFVTFAKRHDTPHGQMAMQELHDSAERFGAVCTAGNATLASKHEASAIQQVHDLAVDHGAKCNAVGGRGGGVTMFSSDVAGSVSGATGTITVTGATANLGTVPTVAVDVESKEKTPVGDTTKQENTGPSIAELQAQLDAQKKENEEGRKALVSLQAERRVEKANAFVDKLVTDNVILPTARDPLVKLHVMASTDDDTNGLVMLADGGQESRLSTLVKVFGTLPSIGLTKEQIAANPKVTVLLNRQQTVEAEEAEKGTPEENDNLLAMTPDGRRALAARRASR